MRRLVMLLFAAMVGLVATGWLHDAWLWLAAVLGLVFASLAANEVMGALIERRRGRPMRSLFFPKLALILFGLLFALIPAEIYLALKERRATSVTAAPASQELQARLALIEQHALPVPAKAVENIRKRAGVLTLPEEWQSRVVQVDGAYHAHYWHGVLHVYDRNMFRRTTPLPPPTREAFRIMVIGDSMTYGYGIDEQYVYHALLAKMLSDRYRVEVVNLGRNGWQSEDILEVLREHLPRLQPHLVIYGVVHNDFLPSQKGQYRGDQYALPVPEALKRYLFERSRLTRFMKDGYDAMLRQAGLRKDFFDDILEDFDGYQRRFGADVMQMNRLVVGAGLPPIVALVLDQSPVHGGRGYRITQVAERLLREAGMNVVPTEQYYRTFDRHGFRVSLWEGHADEQGHAIWASLLAPAVLAQPGLESFRIR